MKKVLRIILVGIGTASLVAHVISYRKEIAGSCRFGSTRYTLSVLRGKVMLRAPPRPRSIPYNAVLQTISAFNNLNNSQLNWQFSTNNIRKVIDHAYPSLRRGTPGDTICQAYERGCALLPLLMDALEDPERFAAAHVLLVHLEWWDRTPPLINKVDDTPLAWPLAGRYDGMTYILQTGPPATLLRKTYWSDDYVQADPQSWHVGAGQLPALRAMWHRRLDIVMASVPLWLAYLPMLVIGILTIRRVCICALRRRRGLCLGCGYDLRASNERCPECGLAITP